MDRRACWIVSHAVQATRAAADLKRFASFRRGPPAAGSPRLAGPSSQASCIWGNPFYAMTYGRVWLKMQKLAPPPADTHPTNDNGRKTEAPVPSKDTAVDENAQAEEVNLIAREKLDIVEVFHQGPRGACACPKGYETSPGRRLTSQ